MTVSRRDALKALATGIGSVSAWPFLSESAAEAFAALQATNAPPKLAFLTADQYATVDALTETIIPEDDHSPGARAARVADYIDLLLSESDAETRKNWTWGLSEIDQVSRRHFKAPYTKLSADQQVRVLSALAKNELDPKTGLDWFFKTTKDAAIRGYYTSEIGIHKELEYKGNVFLKEFVGCTHPEHGYKP